MSLTRARYRLTPDTLGDGQWTDLRVDTTGALIVTMAAGATTSPAKLEDAAHASGDMGMFTLGVANEAFGVLSGTDGDYTPIAVTSKGAVHTTTGVARTTSADAISNSDILARVVDGAGNPAYLASLPLYFNGTTWDRMRGDTTGLKIKPNEDVFEVTLSVDTSAYADGDTFADTQLVSATFFEASGADRTLLNVVVLDKADQGFGIDLFFLDTNVSLGTENAAPSITDANAAQIVGLVRISSGDWIDVGGARVAVINNISQVLRSTTQNLYIAAVVRGAGTYGASDVIVKLGVL